MKRNQFTGLIEMTANIERFKKELERLLDQGTRLELAIQYNVYPKEFQEKLKRVNKGDKTKTEIFLKALPNFRVEYEGWYSEALAVIKQLLPDRVNNFTRLYEIEKGRKVLNASTYVLQDYLSGISVSSGSDIVVNATAAIPKFAQQIAILKAACTRFESSLFEIKHIVQADLLDSEIGAARELLKNKFIRASGAIAGVVLEKHLRQVCDDHAIKIVKKNPTINDLNELLKANTVIDVPQWRHISFLGDIRNLCDHDRRKEPTAEQVIDLIDGTEKVIKTIA
jgi:hypothetical protein